MGHALNAAERSEGHSEYSISFGSSHVSPRKESSLLAALEMVNEAQKGSPEEDGGRS